MFAKKKKKKYRKVEIVIHSRCLRRRKKYLAAHIGHPSDKADSGNLKVDGLDILKPMEINWLPSGMIG